MSLLLSSKVLFSNGLSCEFLNGFQSELPARVQMIFHRVVSSDSASEFAQLIYHMLFHNEFPKCFSKVIFSSDLSGDFSHGFPKCRFPRDFFQMFVQSHFHRRFSSVSFPCDFCDFPNNLSFISQMVSKVFFQEMFLNYIPVIHQVIFRR